MDWDEPVRRKPLVEPREMSAMGVAELEDYIAQLSVEIERARAAIAARNSARAGAESVFKK